MYWLTFHSRKSATPFSTNFRKNFFSVAHFLVFPVLVEYLKRNVCVWWLINYRLHQNYKISLVSKMTLYWKQIMYYLKIKTDCCWDFRLFFKERLIYLDLIFFEKLKALWKADIIFNVQYRFIFHLILHLYLTSFISTYVMTN